MKRPSTRITMEYRDVNWRRLNIIGWTHSPTAALLLAGIDWEEVRIVGWSCQAHQPESSALHLSLGPAPGPAPIGHAVSNNDNAIAIVWNPLEPFTSKVEKPRAVARLQMQFAEPLLIAGDDDVVIIGAAAHWLGRHLVLLRRANEHQSLKTAYECVSGEHETVFGAGPLLVRYLKNGAPSPRLSVGAKDIPFIEASDGRQLRAHSYLEIPIGANAPIDLAQIALDNVGGSKDAIVVAMVASTDSFSWHEKSTRDITSLLEHAIAQIGQRTSARVIDAQLIIAPHKTLPITVPPALRAVATQPAKQVGATKRPWWQFWRTSNTRD